MTEFELLNYADELDLYLLKRDTLETKNGTYCIKSKARDYIGASNQEIVNSFGVFFAELSQHFNPALSYKKIYENLSANTEAEKLFKNFYRIAKLVRNAEEHNKNAKTIDAKTTTISYSHKGSDFFMKYNNGTLMYLERALCEYFYLKMNGYSEKYSEQLLGLFFNFMNEHFYLSEFKDDITDSNKNVSPFFDCGSIANLNIVRRCSCHDISYTLVGNNVVFDCPASVPNSTRDPNDMNDGVDIFIDYNNKSYIIPSEVLDEKYTISLADFLEYEMKA